MGQIVIFHWYIEVLYNQFLTPFRDGVRNRRQVSDYVGISPKRKGWCNTSTVGISLSDETKVIAPVGEPRNTALKAQVLPGWFW